MFFDGHILVRKLLSVFGLSQCIICHNMGGRVHLLKQVCKGCNSENGTGRHGPSI
jgi:hypothetical protein